MDHMYPQLKQFVVQTVQNRKIVYSAIDEMDARRIAEFAGHRITRILAIEDFQKYQDAYYMGYADGAEFGEQVGFHKGYKYRDSLEQREEEEITERVSQITVAQKAQWEGRI